MSTRDHPNILLIMSDEHAPMFSGPYGHKLVQTPNLDRLADNGVTFANAYCNSPLCVPSRMSFMTGRYIHHIGAWDNATPLPSDVVTWAHLLRSVGYDVVLCSEDPKEFHDLAAQKAYRPVLEDLKSRLLSHWDGIDLERQLRQSQKERLLIESATGGEWRRFRSL